MSALTPEQEERVVDLIYEIGRGWPRGWRQKFREIARRNDGEDRTTEAKGLAEPGSNTSTRTLKDAPLTPIPPTSTGGVSVP